MTQMASLLAVATVVIDLRTLFLQSETGGLYVSKTTYAGT